MQFTILGSGSSSPHAERASSGYWLETSGGSLMLDMSGAAFHRAAQENLDWANLDAIWISHFHLDHVGGLAPFLFGTKYAFETQARTKPLRIFAPKGLREILERFDSAYDYGIFKQPFPFEIVTVEAGKPFEILPNVEAQTFSTPHTPESMAIRVEDADKSSMIYTADTGFDENLGKFARNVDLFLMESSFIEKSPVALHIATPECVELIKIAEPRRAMFTHFYAEWDNVNFDNEVKKYAPPCEVLQAKDGLQVEIGG